MNNLKYEERINFAEWSRQLYRLIMLCISVIFSGELVVFLSGMGNIGNFGWFSLLVDVVLVPTAVQLTLLFASIAVTNYFIKMDNPFAQSITMCTFISLICFSVLLNFADVASTGAVMAIPMLASLLYIDRKPLAYSAALCAGLYLFFITALKGQYPIEVSVRHSAKDMLATLCYMASTFIVSNGLLVALSRLVNNTITKDEQLKRDSFTMLLNHTAFFERLDELIVEHMTKGSVFCLVIWDMDSFKAINDTFGHDFGDKIILQFAEILHNSVPEGSLAFRYAGDEFALLLSMSEREAVETSILIRDEFVRLSRNLKPGGKFTLSAGLCEYDAAIFSGSNDFFKACDDALYAAKETRNAIRIWRVKDSGKTPAT